MAIIQRQYDQRRGSKPLIRQTLLIDLTTNDTDEYILFTSQSISCGKGTIQ